MTGLVEFLTARIDEDEAAASAAGNLADYSPKPGRWHEYDEDGVLVPDLGFTVSMSLTRAEHIGRFDPLRMLAECAAKRRIVARAKGTLGWSGPADENEWTPYEWNALERRHDDATDLLKTLAAVYASHPDYQPDWQT